MPTKLLYTFLFYVVILTAQGNVLAVYEHKHAEGENGTFTLAEQHLYGASRIGMTKPNLALNTTTPEAPVPTIHYELTNHLGNVMAVITDEPTDAETPAVESLTDYYPFGMTMPGRSYNAHTLRHGFTGHEKESDLAEGIYTTEYRLYDARVGRWLSVDPLWLDNAGESPYLYCSGMPMTYFDPDGREKYISFPTSKVGKEEKSMNETLISYAKQYKENNGVVHTFQHGINGSKGVAYAMPDGTKILIKDVESFETKILDNTKTYKENKEKCETTLLVMHSCQAGQKNGFAQKVSEKLDVVVVAPSENISVTVIYYEGEKIPHKYTEEIDKNGVYNIFYKGKLLESFSGKSMPLFNKPSEVIKKYQKMYNDKYCNDKVTLPEN